MDLQISAFLLFLLFTAGHSFSCYECLGLTGSCSDQTVKTCPSGSYKCMSSTTVVLTGGSGTKVKIKDCIADCVNGSMNFGLAKASLACCNTDQCNVQDTPAPSFFSNGKTCYSCDEKSCSNILSCSGSEDRCFKAKGTFGGQTMVMKGCVSKSICDAESSGTDIQEASCCEGNLCNGAQSVSESNGVQSVSESNGVQSVSQSFLFLCCSLLSFILLH